MTNGYSYATALTGLVLGVATNGWSECSDAGFCRLPGAGQKVIGSDTESTLNVRVLAGYAEGDPTESLEHSTIEAAISWRWHTGTTLALTVPWVRNEGDLGSSSGLGDVLIAGEQPLFASGWGDWSVALGVRLPTGDDDALSGAGLGYQPGLGTTDALAGLTYRYAGFDARVGYIASFGTNGTPGIELERGDDVALALGYSIQYHTWHGRLGYLVLQRLDDSSVVNPAGGRQTVEDSAGMQSNVQLNVGWSPTTHWSFDVTASQALQSREDQADIDGLTRSWSVSLSANCRW